MYSLYELQHIPRPQDFYGDILRHHREEARLTVRVAAEKTGVHRNSIDRYEMAQTEPGFENYIKLENCYREIVRARKLRISKREEMEKQGLLFGTIYDPDEGYKEWERQVLGSAFFRHPYEWTDLMPLSLDMFCGDILREHRTEARETLEELGEKVCINMRQLSRYERGDAVPSITHYCFIEDHLRKEVLRQQRLERTGYFRV